MTIDEIKLTAEIMLYVYAHIAFVMTAFYFFEKWTDEKQ